MRSPTCFNWNQNTPSETKVGIIYDLLFLTQKTPDKILKYKIQKKKNLKHKQEQEQQQQQNLFGYSVDHIKGHGQGPFSPNPHTQFLCLPQRYHVSYPAEVHLTGLAAWLPVLQLE